MDSREEVETRSNSLLHIRKRRFVCQIIWRLWRKRPLRSTWIRNLQSYSYERRERLLWLSSLKLKKRSFQSVLGAFFQACLVSRIPGCMKKQKRALRAREVPLVFLQLLMMTYIVVNNVVPSKSSCRRDDTHPCVSNQGKTDCRVAKQKN